MAKQEQKPTEGNVGPRGHTAAPPLPPGVKLLRTLAGHQGAVMSLAFDPQGGTLASGSADGTVRLWETQSGKLIQTLDNYQSTVCSLAFDPQSRTLASGSSDGAVKLWEPQGGKLLRKFEWHQAGVLCLAFDPQGKTLASGGDDDTLKLWDVKRKSQLWSHLGDYSVRSVMFDSIGKVAIARGFEVELRRRGDGKLVYAFVGHGNLVRSVAFDPQGGTLASGSEDKTVKFWETRSGKLLRTLEGHTGPVDQVAFSPDGRLLASKSKDQTIRVWNCETWETVAVIPESTFFSFWTSALAFHPTLPLLAAAGSEPDTPNYTRSQLIHIYELDFDVLLGRPSATPAIHYVNAKAVLVGDTGVGKSGLSLVLNKKEFEATESTAGRHVWTLDSQQVQLDNNRKQTRETLLWDLAGQPGYRVIHQLHLNEVAVALVVFDARSEIDPLAGVRHWERALRLAHQRQGDQAVPMKKYLVSARTDRGGVSVSKERIESIIEEFGFDGYFETSAKEGWNIDELRAAIKDAIPWDDLPVVSSEELFAQIKAYLLIVKETGRLLAPVRQLYEDFDRAHPGVADAHENLSAQFETCISRLENRDLIRRLSFGGYVLLQPELLDAYGSAMVNTAKDEPDGLGSLAEDVALAGKFFVPKEQKVNDGGQEQLLLHATVEELVRHDLALRENADDGRYLVFPSQFNRDYEDAPEPKGKAVAITFDGPVQNLYSTLAVRLGHSGLFTTGRQEMWRNAAVFDAKAGGKCGLFLHEFAEARGRLILFFPDEHATPQTRFHFEEFILAHAKRRALDDSVELVRFFVCPDCGDPVPDSYVKRLRDKGKSEFNCPCGGTVSLVEPKERIHFRSEVEAMDKSADRQRDFDAFLMSAKGETRTTSFQDWAGGERVTLAIAFTDVVGSTAMGEEIREEAANEVRRAHFEQSRKLIDRCQGREIKTIGDSFMAAFKSVDAALDYAMALQADTGHPKVQIRAGIHIGAMTVEEGDVFGGTVNFAARVIGAIQGAEIWLSDRAKEDIDRLGAGKHKHLKWEPHESVPMKGFPGKFTLWELRFV